MVELTVLTEHWRERDIEHDIDGLMMPLRKKESGKTTVDDYEVRRIS